MKRRHTTGDPIRQVIPSAARCKAFGHEAALKGTVVDQLCMVTDLKRYLASLRRRLRCSQCGARR